MRLSEISFLAIFASLKISRKLQIRWLGVMRCSRRGPHCSVKSHGLSAVFLTSSCLLLSAFPLSAAAWVYSENVSVIEITEWQDDAPIYIKFSNGSVCYLQPTEKNLYGLILSIYSSGRKAYVHCHDQTDTYGGVSGHRLHRVLAVTPQ